MSAAWKETADANVARGARRRLQSGVDALA